jgi:hypothetical protein
MLPPDEPPKLSLSTQMHPPLPTQGKIKRQDKCRYCKGKFVVLQQQGEDHNRVFHSKPPCAFFEKDVNAYMQWHDMSRDQRRAAKSKKKGRAASRRRR